MSARRGALPRSGYLGFEVSAEAVEPVGTRAFGPAEERWIVSEIDVGSPAERGGLALGDEVFALDGVLVESLADLRFRAGRCREGERARFLVLRGEEELELVFLAQGMPLESLAGGRVELGEVPWRYLGKDYRLRAIWTLPEGSPAHAALWLLPSATWVSQESPLTSWDPSYHLVKELTKAGVATLRVDRSGLGDSEGPLCTELDFEAEMSFWRAARSYFLGHERVAKVPAFLYGRSLGGMLAPLLAQGHSFSGLIVWGSSSERWHSASRVSFAQQLEQKSTGEEALRSELARMERLLALVYDQKLDPEEALAMAPELKSSFLSEFVGKKIHERAASFFHQLDDAKIADAWRKLDLPVLAIHAEYDILTRKPELERIAELAGAKAQCLEMEGVDHFMHERESMKEAISKQWGGDYSPQVTRVLLDFFRRVAASKF